MKKTSILLLAAMLMNLTACGDSTPSADDTPPAVTESVSETTAEPELLPERSLGGKSFRFATYESNLPFFYTAEMNGDIVNDAVYTSVSRTMDQYDFEYETIIYGTSNGDVESYVNTTILAGDDECDMVSGHDGVMWQLSMDNSFLNIRGNEYYHFDKPWWMTYANEELMVNGRQYVFSSYMSYKSLSAARCLYMNTALAEDYNIAVPYDSVYNGTWTLDQYLGMVKDFYQDATGNGARDREDIYGWAAYSNLYCLQATYINCYKENADGIVTLDFDREKLIDLTSKIGETLLSSPGGYISGTAPDAAMFLNNKSLFYYDTLHQMTTAEFREGSVEYTLLPLPKYDETQSDYITGTVDPHCGIPITCADPETAHFIVEALSIAGYDIVRPAYFDQALSAKFSQNEDMPKMLQIIGDGLTLDMAYLCSSYAGTSLGRFVMNTVAAGSTDKLASSIETILRKEQRKIDIINEFFAQE